jgi:hypothetical protein
MLKSITDRAEIAKCQRHLETYLKKALPNSERLTIGHPGGSFEGRVYHDTGFWFSTKVLSKEDADIPRYWNGFGVGKREGGHQIIIVEINPPLEGSTKQVSGLFAKDQLTGTYFLLHRGRIGGGRKGIGKNAFQSWYRGVWVQVYDRDATGDDVILVATLGSEGLLDQIRCFVQEVAKFKNEVTLGSLRRAPRGDVANLTFAPEFHGKKSGKRQSRFEYESYHGLVVSALEEKLREEGIVGNGTVFNTRFVDLGIQVDGYTKHIFEVKSSADLQSIYTGIGQLMFHSSGRPKIQKTMVLPKERLAPTILGVLNQLQIKLLKYEIRGNRIEFMT